MHKRPKQHQYAACFLSCPYVYLFYIQFLWAFYLKVIAGRPTNFNSNAFQHFNNSINFFNSWKRLKFCNTKIRSEEHTSELQSLMRISYAVFCLKKKKKQTH